MMDWFYRAAFSFTILAMLSLSAAAQTGNPGGPINDHLGDMDYGVCRGIDPVCFHDWHVMPKKDFKVLLFTRSGGPRHITMGPPLPPGINPPLAPENLIHRGMLRLAAANGFKMDYSEDLAAFNNLMQYNAVIFYSTSRDMLDDSAKTALRQYIRAGGGFVAVHNAFGSLYNWPYYEGLLGGANFYNHRQLRQGDVVIQDPNDSSTKDLPARFPITDEFYNLIPFPTHVRFLATVDEKSWPKDGSNGPGSGEAEGGHPGHGSFHPVSWCQYYDGGKAWMTTMGHDGNLLGADPKVPGAVQFQKMLIGGIKSVMGLEPFCQ